MKQYIFAFALLLIHSTLMFASEAIDSSEEKVVVLIIGTGRCGSSCLTGILNIMGLELGDKNELFEPNKFNPKGFFESKKLDGLTAQILGDLNMSPSFIRIVDWNAESKLNIIKNKIANSLKLLIHYPKCGFKSPYVSYLLRPFIDVLEELGYKVKLVLIVRDPEQVVRSCQTNSKISDLAQYRNISRVLTSMLIDSGNTERLVIKFDDLFNDNLEKTLKKIVDFLPWLKSYAECKVEIDKFIDKNLKHF